MKDKFFISAQGSSSQKRARNSRYADKDKAANDNQHADVGGDIEDVFSDIDKVDDVSVSESESDEETAQQKRVRLAKSYINSLAQQSQLNDGEFDAAEIDRELIISRLKSDALEKKGKLITPTADSIQPAIVAHKALSKPVNAVVISSDAQFIYVATKGKHILKFDVFSMKQLASIETSGPIFALALSHDDKYLAFGGQDKLVYVYDTTSDQLAMKFNQHRDFVTALAFKSDQHMLYSASADRAVKVFNVTEKTYVETLFGHQDQVMDLDSIGSRERCISVGSRDKTVRLWKIVEESQLIFRASSHRITKTLSEDLVSLNCDEVNKLAVDETGSVDVLACLDEEYWVTGSDSGSLCLWNTQKKKPVFTLPHAHGRTIAVQNADGVSSEVQLNRDNALEVSEQLKQYAYCISKPNWISAVACARYSDLIISGSCDGHLRLFQVDREAKRLTQIKTIPIAGWINSIKINKNATHAVVGVSKEQKFGRWDPVKGSKNKVIIVDLRVNNE
ncbi:hypothetical protein MP228_007653 [Amoeboaphelidium protococcarum]|nr:hypothetical protein MP228_007653 [Amoeboaphelidium protococcarum]